MTVYLLFWGMLLTVGIVAFLSNYRQYFSPCAKSEFMWCIHIVVWTWLMQEKIAFYFIGSVWLPYDRELIDSWPCLVSLSCYVSKVYTTIILGKCECCILTFDQAKHAIPKRHIPMASYGKKLRRRACLTIWDKVKSCGTVIDWCTGREWPVNCMTVISAWWRSNMPFQWLSGRWNYYINRWWQEVS